MKVKKGILHLVKKKKKRVPNETIASGRLDFSGPLLFLLPSFSRAMPSSFFSTFHGRDSGEAAHHAINRPHHSFISLLPRNFSMSLRHILFSSLSLSLSLSLLFLSLNRTYGPWCNHRWQPFDGDTRQSSRSKAGQNAGARLLNRLITADGGSGPHVGRSWLRVVPRRLLINFSSQRGCQSIPLGLLVLMVPSICYENAWIVSTLFCANWQKVNSWFEATEALFWGNDLESILMAKMISNDI